MGTMTSAAKGTPTGSRKLVEMNWDPITRIVGSLGIFTKIDFDNRQVAECHSTSSIFRGYSIFMKGKDPRDAHFITSRICGICGDNHATCATYAQNMAFGVRPPALGEWIVNLGEAAEYMFDHNIFQDNLVGVDFCEQMVKETNPSVLAKAEKTAAPHSNLHGFRTIADIMNALNPFTGSFYREALQMSRMTREMFCLMEGRHVHPSTLYPGGVGTVPTIQLFTDYLVRLMKYVEFMKKVVPLHDDLFDFFYDALPGYEEVGRRRVLLGCWGSFNNPAVCDYSYKKMTEWGRAMYVTPGVVVDDKLVTTDLVDINLNIRILLGSSYYDGWENSRKVCAERSAGQSRGSESSMESDDDPATSEARLRRQVHVGHVAALARQEDRRPFGARYGRRTDRAALGDGAGGSGGHWLHQVDRTQREDVFAEDDFAARGRVRMEDSEVEQCHRTRPRADVLPGVRGVVPPFTLSSRRWRNCTREELRRGRSSRCRRMPSAAASTKRCAACCRITSSFATARSPTTIRIRRRRGTRIRGTFTERRDPTRMRCRTRRSSKKMARTNSKA